MKAVVSAQRELARIPCYPKAQFLEHVKLRQVGLSPQEVEHGLRVTLGRQPVELAVSILVAYQLFHPPHKLVSQLGVVPAKLFHLRFEVGPTGEEVLNSNGV